MDRRRDLKSKGVAGGEEGVVVRWGFLNSNRKSAAVPACETVLASAGQPMQDGLS